MAADALSTPPFAWGSLGSSGTLEKGASRTERAAYVVHEEIDAIRAMLAEKPRPVGEVAGSP
jgi:hypothetical protein